MASADLEVTVVPAPIHFRLVFEPPALTVAAGSKGSVSMRILGDIPRDATFDLGDIAFGFMASSTDESKVQVVTESYGFPGDKPGRFEVRGVAVGSATATMLSLGLSGAPPDSTAEGAQLPVTVVPPPVHLQLAFDPTSLTVAVGSTATATLNLPDVPEDATVTVTLGASGEAAQLRPDEVTFTAATTSRALTVTGVAAGSAEVFASPDSFGLPPDSTVEGAQLPVTVVLPTVHLALAFEPPALTVAVGATATAVLSLPAVPRGAAGVTVALSAAAATTALVMPREVAFTAQTSSRTVTVTGVAEGSVAITAAADENALVDSGFPPDSTVANVDLPVTVVPPPVHLQLAFEPTSLTLVAGGSMRVVLRLLGDVPADADMLVQLRSAESAVAATIGFLGLGPGGCTARVRGYPVSPRGSRR